MKHTQRKDAVRNILKQIVSYLSIVVIAMLAVNAYLGINFAAKAIGDNGNDFFKATNFRDIQVISTKLVTEEDIGVIGSVEGVADVEGVYRIDARVKNNGTATDVMVVSLTQRINTVQILEGRLPEGPNECVLEKSVDEATELGIGDTITVTNSKGGVPDYLKASEYVITGIVLHPDHSAWPLFVPGARYVLVNPEAFDTEALGNCYMTAEVRVAGVETMHVYDDKYIDTVGETVKRIEAISGERAQLRFDYIHDQYEKGISTEQVKLDDAKKQLEDARTELDTKWQEYNDGLKKLDDAKATIEESEKQLADAKKQLDSAKAQLDDAESQLSYGKVRLEDAKAELEDAEVQLEDAKTKLNDAREELDSTYQQIEEAKETIKNKLRDAIVNVLGEDIADEFDWSESDYEIDVDDPSVSATKLHITEGIVIDLDKTMGANIFALISSLGIPEEDLKEAYENTTGKVLDIADKSKIVDYIVNVIKTEYSKVNDKYEELASGARSWDEGHDEYITKLAEYEEAEEKYDAGVDEYNSSESTYFTKLAEYNNGKSEYEEGLNEYEHGKSALEQAKKDYEDGKKLAADGLKQLQDGEDKYEKGMAEYNDGVVAIAKAMEDMNLLDACRWVVLDDLGSVGYCYINNGRINVSDLGGTFAIIFILVGALVIYATVGRTVEEQRRLVGATKALGLYNREILAKYMAFGVSGTVLGMILGFFTGYFGIQRVVLGIYGRYYVFGAPKNAVDLKMTLIVFAGGLILSSLTVLFACTNLMKSTAIVLMQDSVPGFKRKSRKVNANRKTRKGSLYGHMILLNMLSDKKRVIVTIASVAGVCTLLSAGMTMNFAVKKSINQQFSDIEVYDIKVTFDSAVSDSVESDIAAILDEEGVEYVSLSDRNVTYDLNGKLFSCELICGDISKLDQFFIRRDPSTMEVISDKGDGIWIHYQTAHKSGLKTGDAITLYDAAMNPYSTTVTGIYENRVGYHAFMDGEVYFDIFGKRPVNNTYYIKTNGKNEVALTARIAQVEGFLKSVSQKQRLDEVQSMAAVLDLLSLLFIAIAAMMAYFILLNLVNMYITQKKKELTIMRINGFTVKETIRYVSLELIVTTILGIVFGLLLGSLLGVRILSLIEGSGLHIIKDIQFEAWGAAALITVFFATIISAWALRKVKYLKLTDVAEA